MADTPRISILIPTRGRPGLLSNCLECLAKQAGFAGSSGQIEVLVLLDGPDGESGAAAEAFSTRLALRVIECPRLGIAHAKNQGLALARGELIVLLNDDVLPGPGFLAEHLQGHQDLGGMPGMVVGWSPWVVQAPDTLFQRLLRETSMVFFYDRMVTPEGRPLQPPAHDWGYRHAWNLNLSFRRDLAVAVGGFRDALANCCYEDVEFAYRFTGELGDGDRRAPVRFRVQAVAPHDHRYTPAGYLEREFRLGYSAYGLAHAAPDCARDIFNVDLLSDAELDYARRFIEHESRQEPALRAAFERLGDMPAATLDAENRHEFRTLLSQQQLVLKRLAFRRGLVAASREERIEGLFHPIDGLHAAPGVERHLNPGTPLAR